MTQPEHYMEQARQLVTFFFARVKDRPSPTVTKRLMEAAASALAEAATQGQVVGIERVAQILDARAKKNEDEFNAPPSAANSFCEVTIDTPAGYAIWHDMNQFKKLAAEVRALSPSPDYLNRVRNEAATAALEQAAQLLEQGQILALPEAPETAETLEKAAAAVRALKSDAAIGDDNEHGNRD